MQQSADLSLLLLRVNDERLHEDSHGNRPGRGPVIYNALNEPMLDVLQGRDMLGAGDRLQGKGSR